jgi:hypothetical protein
LTASAKVKVTSKNLQQIGLAASHSFPQLWRQRSLRSVIAQEIAVHF